MANSTKDTVYIDVEDEITAVIDKVVNAKHKIVALVLPKRATVFQSPVNMKLLQKAAKSAKKSLVLITSDKGILAIAAVSGVHVAKSLTTKPEIPKIEQPEENIEESVDLTGAAIAGAAGAAAVAASTDDKDEAIELDNTDERAITSDEKPKSGKKKLMKIPDFSSFRLKVGLGIAGVVLLVVLWFVAFVVMPKATVTVNTDTSTTSVNTQAIFRVGAEEVDVEENIIPAERVQAEKIDSIKVPATGQKDIGEKATGTLTLTNCIDDGEQKVVPAGTRFTKDGLTFVTAEQVILPFAIVAAGDCISADFGRSRDVDAVAEEAGPQYNISEGSYNSSISGIQAYGSDMSGGSSEIVKVISDEDVQKAEQQLKGTSKTAALNEMKSQLEESGKTPVEETLAEGTPKTTVVPAVGKEADEVEVTITITYNLQGVNEDDLSAVLDHEINEKMGEDKKNIKDNGIEAVRFQVSDNSNEADTNVTLQTVATLGPDIDEAALREEIAGKKRGDIEKQIEEIDGVRSVSVEYSPAWVTTTPKSADKITIVFNEPDEE